MLVEISCCCCFGVFQNFLSTFVSLSPFNCTHFYLTREKSLLSIVRIVCLIHLSLLQCTYLSGFTNVVQPHAIIGTMQLHTCFYTASSPLPPFLCLFFVLAIHRLYSNIPCNVHLTLLLSLKIENNIKLKMDAIASGVSGIGNSAF